MKEARHKKTNVICFHLYEISRIGKSVDRRRTGGFQGVVGGIMESNCLTFVEFPFEMMKTFWNQIEVVVAQHHECTEFFTLKW